jgi:hypothetical protein
MKAVGQAFSRFPGLPDGAKPVATFLICAAVIAAAVVMCTSPALAQASPFGAAPAASGFAGWVLSKQAIFYRALSATILMAKEDGSALWTLMGIAFVYGVFHAAGPGHGKAVISSYLLANDETWRRGVALSFASALVQSFTAILIVAVAAVLLGGTAKMMGQAVRVIEIASYALIILLGSRLLWVKGLGMAKLSPIIDISRPASNPIADIRTMMLLAQSDFRVANTFMPNFTVTPAIMIIRTVMITGPTCCHGVMPMVRSRKSSADRTAGSAACRRSSRSDCGPVPAPSSSWCSRCRRACYGPAWPRPS